MTPDKKDNTADTRAVISVRLMEIIVACLLLAFGLTITIASYRLGAGWASDGPRAGYFPFYIGLIISISSVITLVQVMRQHGPKSKGVFVERGQLKLVLAVLVPALVFVLVIQWFGIYLAAAIYMTVFMIWLGKYSWWKAVLMGVSVATCVFFMFEIWFQVPLHKGTWYDPLSLFGL